MDFAKLDLKAAAEAAEWLHLSLDGEPMYSAPDKPCRVKIGKVSSPKVMALLKRSARIEMLKGEAEKLPTLEAREARLQEIDMIEAGVDNDLICAMIVGFDNIEWDGKPLSPDNREAILSIFDWSHSNGQQWRAQMLAKLQEVFANFTKPASASSPSQGKSDGSKSPRKAKPKPA